jgi:DNA-binding response OmpR family regulator
VFEYFNNYNKRMANSVLVVEDDIGIRKYLKELLLENGYSAQTAQDGISAMKMVEKTQPNLVVLDLGLPDIAGETLCKDIKKNFPEIEVVILTARDSISDVVQGLDIGADDYVTKPFTAEELLARIRARLRAKGQNNTKLKVADLELDTKTLEVKRGNRQIKLTPQEFKLLEYLMGNQNQVLTREMILNRIWPSAPDVETRVVDVYIGYLRKKVDAGEDKNLIHSIRGFGYVIKDTPN